MRLSKAAWDQLRNKTAGELIAALERDGWGEDEGRGSVRLFRHPDGRRAAIHYHPQKTYGPKLLKSLLADIGWTENDLRRLKLIR